MSILPIKKQTRLLPFAVFAFFILCCVLHPQSPLHTHQLLDTDDYMRLNETVNWLQSAHPFGDGWFDLTQPRLSPGEHVIVHWSRLVDLPISLVMLPLIPVMGMQSAALTASFIVPPLSFVLLLMLVPALARPLIGRPHADLAAVLLLFSPAVLLNFLPGRVDHHGYQIIIGAFGLQCLQRMVFCPKGWKAAIAAAFAFAAGLWIGTEALPWVILFCGCLALLASWRGGFVLRNAALFGLALPLTTAAAMLLALRPEEYNSRALSWFSGADLIFAALADGVFVFGWLMGRQTQKIWLRMALMAALGLTAGLLFLCLVPDMLTGAYADYDSFFNDTLIANIGEAQPFLPSLHVSVYSPASFVHAALLILHTIFLPCLTAIIVCWNIIRRRNRTRIIWFMHGCFLLPALVLTLFWQVRVGWFAQAFSIAPVAWLVWRWWIAIAGRGYRPRPRFLLEMAAFALIAPLPVVLLPAIISEARIYPDILLFPAMHAKPQCPLHRASGMLSDVYGAHPLTIMSGVNEGAELLFRTPHNVIAAPYNVVGNRDGFDFFNARDERKAMNVMARRHIDLVLVCRSIPAFYAGLDSFNKKFNAYLTTDSQGHLHMSSSKEHPTLIERLVDGDIPAWLKQVDIPLDPDYLLFEVKLN